MEKTSLDPNNLTELLFEYEQARNEILHHDSAILQITGTTVVLVTAILGVVFSEVVQVLLGKGFLLLVATIIVLVAMSQIVDRWRTTFRIASYLRAFNEDELKHVKWEKRLLKLRELSPHDEGYGATSGYQLASFTFLSVTTFVLGSWYIMQDVQAFPQAKFFIVGPIVVGAFTVWFLYDLWKRHYKYTLGHAQTFDPLWDTILKEEKETKDEIAS